MEARLIVPDQNAPFNSNSVINNKTDFSAALVSLKLILVVCSTGVVRFVTFGCGAIFQETNRLPRRTI